MLRCCTGCQTDICCYRLFLSGLYSDATIKARGQEWKVHRAIICPQSKYFENALKSDNGFVEGKTATIDLREEPDHVNAMLEFIYCPIDHDVDVDLEGLIKLHVAMHKYQVPTFNAFTADTLSTRAAILIRSHDPELVVEMITRLLDYPRLQVQEVLDRLEEVVTHNTRAMMAVPEFSTVLDRWDGLAKKCLVDVVKSLPPLFPKDRNTGKPSSLITFSFRV